MPAFILFLMSLLVHVSGHRYISYRDFNCTLQGNYNITVADGVCTDLPGYSFGIEMTCFYDGNQRRVNQARHWDLACEQPGGSAQFNDGDCFGGARWYCDNTTISDIREKNDSDDVQIE